MNLEEAVAFFEQHGSYCRTGNGTTFALEAFKSNEEPLLELKELWGGNVYPPPPAAPGRYTWRLYGKKAKELWETLAPLLSSEKRARGNRKLEHCKRKFGEV